MKGTGSALPKDLLYQCGSRIIPLVAMKLIGCCRDFADPGSFVTCTLLGSLSRYDVGAMPTEIRMIWSKDVRELGKVNCMRANSAYVVVGGFSNGGKGLVEVYGA